jgi:hypothetical protein
MNYNEFAEEYGEYIEAHAELSDNIHRFKFQDGKQMYMKRMVREELGWKIAASSVGKNYWFREQTIEDLRENLTEPTYWLDPDGELLLPLDWPTDGPLFKIVSEPFDDESFNKVQVEADDFVEKKYREVHVKEEDELFIVEVTMSGTDHRWEFDWFGGEAWPERMIQGGEMYRARLDDIPEFVILAIEDNYDVPVVPR